MPDRNSRLVYSTEHDISGKKPATEEKTGLDLRPSEQKVVVRLEKKGRGGKSVSVIGGLRISRKKKEGLLRQLKAGLGTGGTVKNENLEIQGDRRDEIAASLRKMGYSPRLSGG